MPHPSLHNLPATDFNPELHRRHIAHALDCPHSYVIADAIYRTYFLYFHFTLDPRFLPSDDLTSKKFAPYDLEVFAAIPAEEFASPDWPLTITGDYLTSVRLESSQLPPEAQATHLARARQNALAALYKLGRSDLIPALENLTHTRADFSAHQKLEWAIEMHAAGFPINEFSRGDNHD